MKRPIMGMLGISRLVHTVMLVMFHFVLVQRSMTMITNTVMTGIINSDGVD